MTSKENHNSLELVFTFKCTSDGSSETHSLSLSPVPRRVEDIKEHIQTTFSIPKCLQKLTLNDHPLSDSQEITDLYIRNKDSLLVTYLATANVEPLTTFAHEYLRPLITLIESSPEAVKQPNAEVEGLMHSCEIGFHHTAYSYLLPWGSPEAEANRQFVIQEGGIDHTLKLYSLLQKSPWASRHQMLQRLEISCLSLLWNFGETAYARQMVVEKGGFEMMIKSLMHYSQEEFMQKYRMHDVFDGAIGCISNYSELECCQLPLVQNKPAMERMLAFALKGPSLNIFTKMLIANCLFRLSHSLATHRYLANPEILQPMLEFFNKYESAPGYQPNVAMRYMICLTLARLLLFSFDFVPEECRERIVVFSSRFLSTAKVRDITTLEERYQYNWITVLPFVETVYASLLDSTKSLSADAVESASVKEKCQYWSISVALLSIQAEMARKRNRQLSFSQGLIDFIVCLPWGMPAQWQEGCRSVVQLFRKDGPLPVPRLSSIAKVTLARGGVMLKTVLSTI